MRGHSGLWPHFRPDVHEYPWRWDKLEEYRDAYTVGDRRPGPEELEVLFTRLGVGTRATPSSLGRWSLYHAWREHRQYSCPNAACIHALKRWTPPRTDEYVKLLKGRVIDLPSAYPNRFRLHPVGTSARLLSEPADGECWTWFGECRVYVPHELALGPFKVGGNDGHKRDDPRTDHHVRQRDRKARTDSSMGGGLLLEREKGGVAGGGTVSWPRSSGTYHAWLWKEQAFDCRTTGCDVEFQHGWGWEWYTTDNAPWVDRMLRERKTMPGGRSGLLGSIVKAATNAAIGYQGIGNRYRPRVQAGRGASPITIGGRITNMDYGEERIGRATMIHWQRYTEMLVARDLYRMALPYAERDQLYRLWFDEMEVAA